MLGARRKALAGFSSTTAQPHQGFVFQADLVQRAPPALRQKAVKLVAGKCALLARVDAFGQDPAGGVGARFKVTHCHQPRTQKYLNLPKSKAELQPLQCWTDYVREDLTALGLTASWFRKAQDRDSWRDEIHELLDTPSNRLEKCN